MSSAGMCGEWLPNAAVTGLEHGDFLTLQEEMPATYASLLHYQDILKNNFDDLHDVDFVVQQGIVWLLGVSSAKTLPGSTLAGLCSDQWASSEECASNDGLAVTWLCVGFLFYFCAVKYCFKMLYILDFGCCKQL
ncbi:unnamed protein product [Polarella glacialis]|uniref:Uncharacterized protein n=1 Tax=Polarella glacialis TaxID=89957 RepID=A0A813K9F7_POLGL|nr:unnamed protein product [Polarella glacialis]